MLLQLRMPILLWFLWSLQFSRVWLFATPQTAACQASLFITNTQSLLKLHVHCVTDAIQTSHPLLSASPLTFNLSQQQGLFHEFVLCIRWPKYWSFDFRISPSTEHSLLISFRMDWLNLLAVQETLRSPLQHHSSKASILQCSSFFVVQLSHPHVTTGKAIPLIIWTFFGKVMSLLFNVLCRFVIVFLPSSF